MSEKIKFSPKREKLLFSKPHGKIKHLQKSGSDFYMNDTGQSCIITTKHTKYIYLYGKNFPKSKIFLFSMVKRDADGWLKAKPHYAMPNIKQPKRENDDYDWNKGRLVGFDLNHAFWRIAYTHKIIRKSTYEKGLDENINCKAIRLATISVLGREKKTTYYENGVQKEKIVLSETDRKLNMIYHYVRFYCYTVMDEVAQELPSEDFESYNTDCIYFRDSKANRKLADTIFASHNLQYKILENDDGDEEEE